MKDKDKSQGKILTALCFIGIMFFSIGFALGINSFLIPVLNLSLDISSGLSYLILAAIFSTFIIFGYPAALTIRAIGYKKTMALSFVFFAVGFLVYLLSAARMSFPLFLCASFVSGIGNTFLQAAVNPYTTILGPISSAARRISIMGILNKVGWGVSPVFLAWIIGKDVTVTQISDLYTPFYVITGIFLGLGLLAMVAPLPEVKAKGEDLDSDDTCTYAESKTSIWQFPHLILGAVTLFFYVGAETIALSTLVDYASYLELPNAAAYGWLATIGMVAGYLCGIIFIPRLLSQASALKICSILGIAGTTIVLLTPAHISIWFMIITALGCSLIWPAVWPLAITDLGRFTKTGSSLLVMAIAGGAIIPSLYGWMKDIIGPQYAYSIILPCFIFILYYSLYGYKIRK